MSVRYRVGLDVGTASMGLVAVSLDESGNPIDIIHHDLRIWNEPLVPKTGTLLNQDRRANRLHRRQIRRRARRMRRIAHLAPLLGLDAGSILASNEQLKNGERVLELRARAVTERIELEDLLRVMLLLSKKRGYKGTFKEPKAKKVAEEAAVVLDENLEQATAPLEADVERAKETKQVKDGIGRLSEELAKRGDITVGQYLYQEHLQDSSKNLKFGKDHSGFYASRAMIEDEFNRIWEKQREFHGATLDKEYPLFGAVLDDGAADLTPRPLKAHFMEAVLYQRPVVWDAGTIGRCELEPDLPRAPMAQPSAQSFRIEKNIADLRWRGAGKEERLTHEQNAVIRDLLHDPGQMDAHGIVSYAKIYEALAQKGIRGIGADGQAQTFTKDRSTKGHVEGSSRLNGLVGDRTRKAFDRLGILEEWEELNPDAEAPDSRTQVQIINFLSGLTSVEEIGGAETEWASRFEPTIRSGKKKGKKRAIDPQIVDFINIIHATEKLDLLGKMGFDTARSAYSIRANRILAKYMAENGTDETDAKCRAYRKCTHSETNALCPRSVDLRESSGVPDVLRRPASTGNQIVDISLEQIYRAMQELIAKHGMPTEMHIELARDMKLSAKGRREIERDQRDKAKGRETVFAEICKLGGAPSGKNIDKFLLASDMGNKCPYCRRTLTMTDILSDATEFEHILPRSRSGVGKKNLSHSLLACKSCNSKKGNQLAWDAFADSREKLERSADELSPGIVERIEMESGVASKGKSGKRPKKATGASARARIMENKARWLLQQSFEEVQDSESSIDSVAASAANDTSWISKMACEWLQSVTSEQIFPTRGRITAVTRRRWGLETVIPEVRTRASLPVFTTRAFDGIASPLQIEKGQEVGVLLPGAFESYKKYWEGHSPQHDLGPNAWIPPIDKRRDHRHHLVDALTIALTTRSHAQRLSVGHKKNADVILPDHHGGFDLLDWRQQYSPGMPHYRDKALSMVENAVIRRKSDRHASGQLLEETAYARRRGEVLASRSKLSVLKEAELENIVDSETRKAVIAQIAAYKSGDLGDKPVSFAQAMAKPIYHRFIGGEGKGTVLKSVLVARTDLSANSPSLIEVKNDKNEGKPFIYKSAGNAYIEIDDSGNAKLVSQYEAARPNSSNETLATLRTRRFYSNDLVREVRPDGEPSGPSYVVTSMTTGPTIKLLPVSETCTFDQAKKIGKLNKTVSGKSLRKWVVIDP